MAITLEEHAERYAAAVEQFNSRLKAGGEALLFSVGPVAEWLPKLVGRRLFQEYFLAVDDTGAVHGGYALKHQDFWINDQLHYIADLRTPVSEGSVNRSYAQVGVQILRDAVQRQPLLYGLGIGSHDAPLARLLVAARWSMFSVPFFFHIVHPAAFLRHAAFLRRSTTRRWALDSLAATGLGWLGIRAVQAFNHRRTLRDPAIAWETVDEFSDWADDVWRQCRGEYGMTAVRDAETLRILYPKGDDRFIRLKVTKRSRAVGWAVMLNSQLHEHKHFGDMRLGSIVDGFCAAADVPGVVRAATTVLQSQGVDLIVSNQSHAAWIRGFRETGFLRGPSNFIFASSPKLTELLRQGHVQDDHIHMNRGDGDGPINL